MPYITPDRRIKLDALLSDVASSLTAANQKNGFQNIILTCASLATMANATSIMMPGMDALVRELDCRLSQDPVKFKGDLNYCVTKLLTAVIDLEEVSYDKLFKCQAILAGAEEVIRSTRKAPNMVAAIATLRLVSLEVYRRLAAPYEDSKSAANGDVF